MENGKLKVEIVGLGFGSAFVPTVQVSCLGSGTMDERPTRCYGNPFPVETTHLRFENGLAGEATRSL